LGNEVGGGRDRLSQKDRHNLPVRLTSFVGREAEMAEITGLLANTRLLSLTGAGGSGKTRLAVETAFLLIEEFPDGVWLVELAPLSDPSLVVQAIAETFEVREQPNTPLLESVVGHLSYRRLLLVLDNCEHLIDSSAQVAERLLHACPDLRVLATSREPLHVPGEVVFRVPPLSLPQPEGAADPSNLAAFASIQLFVERARAVSPSFVLTAQNAEDVASLCSHLDGLPLAIELAASRVALFPVSTIVQRLDDRFRLLVGGSRTALSRQQTLQATLEWSYDLLNAEEQALLRALSVFVGGIALDAAEQICGGDDREVLAALGQLVEKSLVILAESDKAARYRLLETVREYGLQRIEESGEREQVEDRHAEWFLQLAARAGQRGPPPARPASRPCSSGARTVPARMPKFPARAHVRTRGDATQ
jgi:non-specific serine/threonine protein kinase